MFPLQIETWTDSYLIGTSNKQDISNICYSILSSLVAYKCVAVQHKLSCLNL